MQSGDLASIEGVRGTVFAGRNAAAVAGFWVTYAGWITAEWGLAVRDARSPSPAHGNADAGTRRVFLGWLVAGLVLGFVLASSGGVGQVVRGPVAVLVGLPVAWIGLGLRLWAVRTLGRFFRRSVTIEADHVLVTAGPYRVLRHPSYTGGLVIGAGLGIATGNLAALAAFTILPLIGILPRIRVEEAALLGALGDRYADYKQHTCRLLPGIW